MPGGTLDREQIAQIQRIEKIYREFKAEIEVLKRQQDEIINGHLDHIDHTKIEQVLKQIHQ